MKPATRKKIEAAIASGRQFESVGQLAKAANVNRQTLGVYKLKFGIPNGVIVSSRERITQALMQAANDGATTLVEAAKSVGVKYSTAMNASEYDQNINLTLTLNKEKAKRDRMQKIVSKFDRHLAMGVSFSETSKLTGIDSSLYYSSCYGLEIEIYSQRTSERSLKKAKALRKRQEERPENQPEPSQRVSRPSGLYNQLLTGRISASA